MNSLTDPGLQRLLTAARRSLERTGGDLTAGIGVTAPTDEERRAISGLLGKHIKPGTKRIAIALTELDEHVRARTGHSLIEALPGGPLRNLPDDAARDRAARAELLTLAESSALIDTPWFPVWVDRLRADGTFTRLLAAPGRFAQAIRVLELIDGSPVLLPKLAARATGHSHALDSGTPLAALVLRALAVRSSQSEPRTAEERRDLWDSFNVIVDDLASRVLVLNLPAEGRGLGEWLTGAAHYGTPFQITLHQLLHHPLQLAPLSVHVCENPAVLREAADRLSTTCPPLICTEGQPSTAFHRLVAQIIGCGGQLAYHGDFDWPGISIARAIISRHHAEPWRLTAADYLAALDSAAEHPISAPLSGTPQATPWDPELHQAMQTHGRTVFEEAIADQLIADLAVD